MRTSAAINFEQVLFRFGRNLLDPFSAIRLETRTSCVAEIVRGETLLYAPVVATIASPLALQPKWMPGLEAGRTASARLPARRPAIPRTVAWGRIQSQTSDDREGVPIPSVNRDPSAVTPLAITTKIRRAQR